MHIYIYIQFKWKFLLSTGIRGGDGDPQLQNVEREHGHSVDAMLRDQS